jgi:phage tail-like protein
MSEAAPSGGHPGAFNDPDRTYTFTLVIQGETVGYFTDCSGLGIIVQVIKDREGGNQVVPRIPGRVEDAPVTLRNGLASTLEVWGWLMDAVSGKVKRKIVSILLLDAAGSEVRRWDLINAWPTEWRGTPLDTPKQEIAIETLTLGYETFQRA